MVYTTAVDGRERRRHPYQIVCETTVYDETNERHIVLDEVENNCWWRRDERIHTRWCTKSTEGNNEGLPIPDGAQNNFWWMRQMNEIHTRWRAQQLEGRGQWRITHTTWCARQLLMSETDEWIHTRWYTKQQIWDPYQMVYKTTFDGWERWRNPYKMTQQKNWVRSRMIHLGGLLFCLAIHPILRTTYFPVTTGFTDDVSLWCLSTVSSDVDLFRRNEANIGFHFNVGKCAVIYLQGNLVESTFGFWTMRPTNGIVRWRHSFGRSIDWS